MKTYTIRQAAEHIGVSVDTLRFYDKQGLLPFVGRGDNGYRVFTEDDFAWLDLIACLKATGMEIREIREFVRWNMEGDETIPCRLELLRSRRKETLRQMAQLQKCLDKLDHKIAFYEQKVEHLAKPGA